MVIRAGLLLAALAAMSARGSAYTVDELRFVQAAQVVVWQDEQLIGRGDSIQVIGDHLEIERPVLGSGRLETVGLESSALAGRMHLKIASNSGFTIQVANPEVAANMATHIVAVGPNARAVSKPIDLRSGVVFEQVERTAIRRGAPRTQAIELELSWSGAAPADVQVVAAAP